MSLETIMTRTAQIIYNKGTLTTSIEIIVKQVAFPFSDAKLLCKCFEI